MTCSINTPVLIEVLPQWWRAILGRAAPFYRHHPVLENRDDARELGGLEELPNIESRVSFLPVHKGIRRQYESSHIHDHQA